MSSLLATWFDEFDGGSPASDAELRELVEGCGPLPGDYLALLKEANGGEGWAGDGFIAFDSIEEVIERWNRRLRTRHPGLLLIGDDGAAMAFGIDLRCGDPGKMEYVELDAVNLHWDEEFGRWPSLEALFQDLREDKIP